jgi:hypothetical protein
MTTLRAKTVVATSAVRSVYWLRWAPAFAAGGSARSSGPDSAYGSANLFADAAAVHVVKNGLRPGLRGR